jgi:hypothetical protein
MALILSTMLAMSAATSSPEVVVIRRQPVLARVGDNQLQLEAVTAELRAIRELLQRQVTGRGTPQGLSRSCGKCHLGQEAQGGFSIESMTADDRLSAIRQMATGEMPPKSAGVLTGEQKNALLDELTNIDVQPRVPAAAPPQATPPAPPQSPPPALPPAEPLPPTGATK